VTGRRVLVCGGRDFADWRKLEATLDRLDAEARIAVVVCGDAKGADTLAKRWAAYRERPVEVFHADWDGHGRAAGPMRNRRMLAEGAPDLVLAFTGGKGTADLVRRAKAAGVPVVEVVP
jgi:predicted polyphosphate/ATP-dependent NAD kinase